VSGAAGEGAERCRKWHVSERIHRHAAENGSVVRKDAIGGKSKRRYAIA